jgi:hypothetical protein
MLFLLLRFLLRNLLWFDGFSFVCMSACCDGLLIVFQFCSVIWLWMLLTGSGDELCRPYLSYFRQWLITNQLLALCLSSHFFVESSRGDYLLAPPPLSSALTAPHSSAVCYCSVPCLFSFFFPCRAGISVCLGCYAGLSQGWLVEYCMMLVAHLLVCQMSPKQVWSQCLAAWGLSCFFSVMWCGEALYGLGFRMSKFW